MYDTEIDQKSDEETVKSALESPDSYGVLMDRYDPKLSRYLKRTFSVSKEDGEDIIQDVFLKAYRNLNDFDTDLKFSSWIYRIAHNEAVSFLRKKNIRPKTVGLEDSLELFKNIASSENIARDLERSLTGEEINKVLSHMDEKYREVLVLKFLEEKDYQEISDILEKPMGTVATLINRAKKQFRERAKDVNINF